MGQLIKEGDELVQSVTLYRHKHWLWHAYVMPFSVFYAAWFYAWLVADFYGFSVEVGIVSLAVLFCIQVIFVLSCVWSVHIMALVTCSKVSHPSEATYAKFVPTSNNGSPELVRIHRSSHNAYWVIFQKLKYSWSESDFEFQGLVFPVDKKLSFYLHSNGFQDEETLEQSKRTFGTNR